jgi:predicted lipase
VKKQKSSCFQFRDEKEFLFLGGALATLTALNLFLPPPDNNESIAVPSVVLINFGSPRIGNLPFAKYASQQLLSPFHHRITHHRDIVPHFPFVQWIHSYRRRVVRR